MAKKEPPKPLFPLKHEFYASLDRFVHEAGMLADAVRQAMQLDLIDNRCRGIIQDRLDAFGRARFDDDK